MHTCLHEEEEVLLNSTSSPFNAEGKANMALAQKVVAFLVLLATVLTKLYCPFY